MIAWFRNNIHCGLRLYCSAWSIVHHIYFVRFLFWTYNVLFYPCMSYTSIHFNGHHMMNSYPYSIEKMWKIRGSTIGTILAFKIYKNSTSWIGLQSRFRKSEIQQLWYNTILIEMKRISNDSFVHIIGKNRSSWFWKLQMVKIFLK